MRIVLAWTKFELFVFFFSVRIFRIANKTHTHAIDEHSKSHKRFHYVKQNTQRIFCVFIYLRSFFIVVAIPVVVVVYVAAAAAAAAGFTFFCFFFGVYVCAAFDDSL